jgi:hypothetical protein
MTSSLRIPFEPSIPDGECRYPAITFKKASVVAETVLPVVILSHEALKSSSRDRIRKTPNNGLQNLQSELA